MTASCVIDGKQFHTLMKRVSYGESFAAIAEGVDQPAARWGGMHTGFDFPGWSLAVTTTSIGGTQ